MEKEKASKLPTKSIDVKQVNYVHKQTIHLENIKAERRFETKNFKYEYTFSPFSFYPIADKPTNVRPLTTGELITKKNDKREVTINKDPISIAFYNDKISKTLQNHTKTPKQLFDYPMTSNQEIGWYSKPLVDNSRWNKSLRTSAITMYASDYQAMKKINPFKIPPSRIRMK